MLLTVRDRLILQSILPKEGDFLTLQILRKLQEDLSFTEEEHEQYKFVQNEGMVTWDDKVEQNKEVEIGKKANDIIILALSKLNEQIETQRRNALTSMSDLSNRVRSNA